MHYLKSLLFVLATCAITRAYAEQVTINADITLTNENDDFSNYNKRALITERKKIEWDIFLETLGQVPCVLLSTASAAGVVAICLNVAQKEWPKEALIGVFPCAVACPAFAAYYLELANKKLFNAYLIQEIDDQIALRENDKKACQETV